MRFRIPVYTGMFGRLSVVLMLLAGLALMAVQAEAATVSSTNGLTITQTAADAAVVGQPFDYTLTVTNTSGVDATFVTVGAELPLGANLITLPNPNLCARSKLRGQTAFACLIGTLPTGTSQSITYSVAPTVTGVLTNLAVAQGFVAGTFVTSEVSLQTPASAAVAPPPVVGPPPVVVPPPPPPVVAPPPPPVVAPSVAPDVQISGFASSGRVLAGAKYSYTYQIKNGGNLPAQGVGFSDLLPAGLTFVSAVSPSGTCSQTAGAIICSLADLPVGAQTTVVVTVTAPSVAGAVSNTAVAVDTNGDSKPSNNQVAITVLVL